MVIAASLPITCAATMAVASGMTGFTLPGMIEEPGCSACRLISPRPARGPEFIQRRSLAIFIIATAMALSCPESATAASCEPISGKKLSAAENDIPVVAESSDAKRRANASWVLIPVPTAVPPMASVCTPGNTASRSLIAFRSWSRQLSRDWPRLTGIASIR